MKRLLVVSLIVAGFAFPTSAASTGTGTSSRKSSSKSEIPAPEVLRQIKLDELKVGMRVRIQLRYSRPFVGTVSRITETMVHLDLSAEETGLPGKLRLRKSDVAAVWELKKQSDEEKKLVLETRREKILAIQTAVKERLEKRKESEEQEAQKEKVAEDTLRKALDVVVAKEEEEQMRALLAEFPPEQWDETRLRTIRENWILRDLAPNARESRFVSIFSEWKRARDVVAILDARQQEADAEQLLLKFPPSEDWSQERLARIIEKEGKGEPVTEREAEFRKSYEAWSNAVQRRAVEVQSPSPAEKEPAPEAEKPPEKKEPTEPEKPE